MQRLAQLLEIVAGAAFHEFAHHLHAFARGGRYRLAGQLLAQHQAKRGVQRHIIGAFGAGNGIARQPPVVHRFHVRAHARILGFADCLVPHPLDRVVTRARIDIVGPHLRVKRTVVMTQAQGETVGKAARFAGLLRRYIAPRHGHAGGFALLRRLVSGPADLRLRLTRNGARRAGQRGLETVEGGFVGHQGNLLWRCLEIAVPHAQVSKGLPLRQTRLSATDRWWLADCDG